jgi:hypothetical protein
LPGLSVYRTSEFMPRRRDAQCTVSRFTAQVTSNLP